LGYFGGDFFHKHALFVSAVGGCTLIDGQKTVCMDKLFNDVTSGDCLVYSFGIGNECSFEVAMADMGCKVRAFDLLEDATDEKFKVVEFECMSFCTSK
jgi:hypothetical protein